MDGFEMGYDGWILVVNLNKSEMHSVDTSTVSNRDFLM